jgi:hypothetical protein
LQQVGAPHHFCNVVRVALNDKFPERWTGRCGAILWPAFSPHQTSLDIFLLWGHVKDRCVCWENSKENHLKGRNKATIRSITPDIFQHVCTESGYRLDMYRARKGRTSKCNSEKLAELHNVIIKEVFNECFIFL